MSAAGRLRAALLVGCAAGPGLVHAQAPVPSDEQRQQCEQAAAQIARDAWKDAVASRKPAQAVPAEQPAAYAAALDQALETFGQGQPACVREMLRSLLEQEVEAKRTQAAQAAASTPSALARSFEAAASNPASVRSLEPAGLISRLALAIGSPNFLSSDKSAVTFTLGGLGLHGKGCDQLPGATCYQQAGALTKLSGSFTFGAKLPEKEITGFSGFPDADKLFDVIAWDLKWRLIGDRDPRARGWNPLIEQAGEAQWRRAKLLNGIAAGLSRDEQALLLSAMNADANAGLTRVNNTIGRSLVVTLKVAGQHLSQEKGRDKYSGTLLMDLGLGQTNLTLNLGYSVVDDVPAGATGPAISLKTWAVAGGLSSSFWRDRIVKDRSAEWTLSGKGNFAADGNDVPMDRKTTWQVQLALSFPVTGTANLPLSITYASDPNSLGKQQYVRGLIGIHYDFGGLKELFKGGS